MKAIKYLALGVIVTLGIFCTVLYSSCAKDTCGAVTCLNHGTCSGGICQCKTGLSGPNCEINYRSKYTGDYKGVPPDDPTSDTTNTLRFSGDDTTDYTLMNVDWIDTANLTVVSLPIILNNTTTGGSNFKIDPVTISSVMYSGNGAINSNSVSMQIKRQYLNGSSNIVNFISYIRQ